MGAKGVCNPVVHLRIVNSKSDTGKAMIKMIMIIILSQSKCMQKKIVFVFGFKMDIVEYIRQYLLFIFGEKHFTIKNTGK